MVFDYKVTSPAFSLALIKRVGVTKDITIPEWGISACIVIYAVVGFLIFDCAVEAMT